MNKLFIIDQQTHLYLRSIALGQKIAPPVTAGQLISLLFKRCDYLPSFPRSLFLSRFLLCYFFLRSSFLLLCNFLLRYFFLRGFFLCYFFLRCSFLLCNFFLRNFYLRCCFLLSRFLFCFLFYCHQVFTSFQQFQSSQSNNFCSNLRRQKNKTLIISLVVYKHSFEKSTINKHIFKLFLMLMDRIFVCEHN